VKIVGLRATPIVIPGTGTASALGRADRYDYGIVEVSTDEGIVGLGEISTLWDGKGAVQCAFVNGPFREALTGLDPMSVNACLRAMDTLVEGAWPARAAVEMALFDIVGRALDTQVCDLLGGPARDAVVLSYSVHMDDPDRMAENAARVVADGFGCVKVKVGTDLRLDVAACAAVRDAIGADVALRVDANMGWRTPKHAIRAIHALEEFDLHSVEQPIPPGSLDDLRLVRESVDTPVVLDESVWGPRSAFDILAAGAADMLNVYVAESGGLTNAALIFRMAETVGVPCVIGAMPELGIGTAAAVHLGLAMTNLHDPCDAAGVMYHAHDVIEERFDIHDGTIRPPDGPGLGVTLDRDALERYHADA
jgi:muconate cycloisomerase